MNSRTYKPFIPQEDNINDVIKAEDINELQRSIENLQEVSFHQADSSFLNRALFALEHHPDANAMIVDLLEDGSRIDHSTLNGITYNENSNSLDANGTGMTGSMVTKVITNKTGKPFRKMTLIVDEYKPEGASIVYEVSYDGLTYYPIKANQPLPTEPPDEKEVLFLRMKFQKAVATQIPRVDAWALLYHDQSYHFKFLADGVGVIEDPYWDGRIIE